MNGNSLLKSRNLSNNVEIKDIGSGMGPGTHLIVQIDVYKRHYKN